jgi:hypothetical protein
MAKKELGDEVKKRGGHARRRRYPGIKGRRPDKTAARRAEAAARQAAVGKTS